MGCSSSKRIEATMDVYRPAPSSFAVFDINAIEEPWLVMDHTAEHHPEKPSQAPLPILEKLNGFEDGARTWEEVSRALEDLKPTIYSPAAVSVVKSEKPAQAPPPAHVSPPPKPEVTRKSVSFRTVEELDAKLSNKPTNELRKRESMRTELKKPEPMKANPKKTESLEAAAAPKVSTEGMKPVKDNMFIVRDRMEREREGKAASFERMMSRRDPLSEYPEKCPPGAGDSVVLYTTSLGGIRRTFEDCNRLRSILESHRVVFDERDVSLHSDFLNELRDLLGDEATVPRLFVKGRYVGGAETVVELNETGRLGKLLYSAKVERGAGRQGCEGCGGARFIPCLDCGGSCKILVNDAKERCCKCNENGLVHCPACL